MCLHSSVSGTQKIKKSIQPSVGHDKLSTHLERSTECCLKSNSKTDAGPSPVRLDDLAQPVLLNLSINRLQSKATRSWKIHVVFFVSIVLIQLVSIFKCLKPGAYIHLHIWTYTHFS